jgi:hypothetical protein
MKYSISLIICIALLFVTTLSAANPARHKAPRVPLPENLPRAARRWNIGGNRYGNACQPAGKICPLSPALTEILADLGYGGKVVGVGKYCDYPSELTSLPDCGSVLLPDFDTIQQLDPDVIVTAAPFAETDLIKLQQMDIEVIVFSHPQSLAGLRELYTNLCLMMEGQTSGAAAAAAFCDPLFARLDTIKEAIDSYLSSGGTRLSGSYIAMLPYNAATGDTLENELLGIIGIDNVAGEYTNFIYRKNMSKSLTRISFFITTSTSPWRNSKRVICSSPPRRTKTIWPTGSTAPSSSARACGCSTWWRRWQRPPIPTRSRNRNLSDTKASA